MGTERLPMGVEEGVSPTVDVGGIAVGLTLGVSVTVTVLETVTVGLSVLALTGVEVIVTVLVLTLSGVLVIVAVLTLGVGVYVGQRTVTIPLVWFDRARQVPSPWSV
jgi:hypothetical protein